MSHVCLRSNNDPPRRLDVAWMVNPLPAPGLDAVDMVVTDSVIVTVGVQINSAWHSQTDSDSM